MGKTTTWMGLMMVLQDFALANHAMEAWKTEHSLKLRSRKIGAARYFLRMQISHVFEAFEIVQNEIEKSAELKAAIEACDARTKKSYQTVIDFIKSDDYKLLSRIRNNIGFHYGPKVVLQSVQRLDKRQDKKRGEKKIHERQPGPHARS